jgi:hypothetical protein
MRALSIIALGALLTGCGVNDEKPASPNVVAAKPRPLKFPAECTTMDAKTCDANPALAGCAHHWIPLAEGDLYTDDILRRDGILETRFETSQAERRICAAAVNRASRK